MLSWLQPRRTPAYPRQAAPISQPIIDGTPGNRVTKLLLGQSPEAAPTIP